MFKQCGNKSDRDGEGLLDDQDACPHNTPEEISPGVDSPGCPLDTDPDGILDYKDLCSGTPTGVAVDKHSGALYLKNPIIVIV